MPSRRLAGRAAQEEVARFKQRLRFALGLSDKGQNEVARMVKASQSVASKWFDEESDTLPGGRFLGRLAKVLGVNGHWLVTGEGHWSVVPTSGRKDVVHVQGQIVGGRDALAIMRRALTEIQQHLEEVEDDAARRAAAVAEDAAADSRVANADRVRRGGP